MMSEKMQEKQSERPIIVVQTGQIFTTRKECCVIMSVSPSVLSSCLTGARSKYKGFTFRFLDEYSEELEQIEREFPENE